MKHKMTAGRLFSLLGAVLTLTALILYGVNVQSAGYFQNVTASYLVLSCVAAMISICLALVLGTRGEESSGRELVSGLFRILAPVCTSYALIQMVSSRIEGFGFLFFSNADVLKEIQTSANMTSAGESIAVIVLLALAGLVFIIAAFLRLRPKENPIAVEKA